MDIRKVKKLIELLEESGIDELEIKKAKSPYASAVTARPRLSNTTRRPRCRLRLPHLPPRQSLLPPRPPLLPRR
jgi:hypothetical protein